MNHTTSNNGITWKRLACPICGSIRVSVFEGKTDPITYYDGILHENEISYPLEIKCAKCGYIIRQDGM